MIHRSRERIDQTGEVFTPSDTVKKMLDDLPNEVWLDPTKTWLEPSCGDGNFLVVILERLMEGLTFWEPDDIKRHTYIIEHMLYGVDIMPDNVEHCIGRLNARNLKHNIVCADALSYDFSFGFTETECNGLLEIPSSNIQHTNPLNLTKKSEMVLVDSGLFG